VLKSAKNTFFGPKLAKKTLKNVFTGFSIK